MKDTKYDNNKYNLVINKIKIWISILGDNGQLIKIFEVVDYELLFNFMYKYNLYDGYILCDIIENIISVLKKRFS